DANELIEKKVSRIVIGTSALDSQILSQFAAKFGQKVWVACDVNNGKIAVKGWTQTSEVTLEQLLEIVSKLEIGGVIVTDISRDGMETGFSQEFVTKVRKMTKLPLIASGGVSSIQDVKTLAKMGFDACIIGKALYENKISLKEAIEVAEKKC
ncbi:MAG: HisA/HisF-related TIM barrel protein, partial [Candidatus Micrarchaeota archaeon]|nr:HisA/HisF-related TIM barrel protein [Candidatus Micrarchaeota archaeon]